jgi:hypothetical protein
MFGEKLNEAQEEYGTAGGSNFFKFKEGKNRLRVLSDSAVIANHWINGKSRVCFGIKNGCPFHGEGALKNANGEPMKPGAKSVIYVLNKSVEPAVIQLAELPFAVTKALDNLQEDEEWGFTTLPMDYDVVVTATGAGTMSVEYQTTPSPKDRGPLPAEVLTKLATLTPVAEIVKTRKEKAKAEYTGAPTGSASGDVQIAGEAPSLDDDDIKPEDLPF